MSTANTASFACDSCGKSYRWRPDFAGKKLKCACGHIMHLTTPPPPPAEGEMYEAAPVAPAPRRPAAGGICPSCGAAVAAGAAICINCGFNLKTGAKVQTEIVGDAPAKPKKAKAGAAAKTGAGNKPRVRGEQSFAHRRLLTDAEDVEKRAKWTDWYIPIGLIVGGMLVAIFGAIWARGIDNIGFALIEVAISTIIDLVLISIAVLITARLFSVGLGSIPTALLKVAGIAIGPGAVAKVIEFLIPFGGDYIGWSVSLILYYILLMVLFDMDFFETIMCTVIMWAIRTWVGYALAILIITSFRGSGMGSIDDTYDTSPTPRAKPGKAPKDADKDDGAMLYPIGEKARVVFFDPRRSATYHSWVEDVVPVRGANPTGV